ncbi:MAG: lipoyl(octanoyl) transferase LipB [Oligoflexia bacterium]|nr:lipoyl(octanoyl) transferase LipB [Oligoflexia bacterium]
MQKSAVVKQPFEVFYNWAGSVSFGHSLDTQEKLKALAKKSQFCFFGFNATDPVITLGLRADESHILFDENQLKRYNILKLNLKRGGEATLHAPGQLVIYPILSLPCLGLKVKDFIAGLEEITQSVLRGFGVETKKEGKYAGLYTERGKICFFGIHVSGGVSQHGLSINVHNDLSLFSAIKSCGEQNRKHDSLSLYKEFSLSKEELFFKWCEKASNFFIEKK